MQLNYLLVLATGFLPLLTGFVWYNPRVMGNVWMKETGLSPEDGKNVNMLPILIANVILGIFLAMGLSFIVIHQQAIYSIFANDPSILDANSPLNAYVADFMSKYGNNFRTFKHGAFHGFATALTIVLPSVAVSALWERRSWKYIALIFGYWAITMMLIGGIICQFA